MFSPVLSCFWLKERTYVRIILKKKAAQKLTKNKEKVRKTPILLNK